MGMVIRYIVEVELTHVSGKFASKDDLREKIREEIEGADPGSVTSDDDAEYEVSSFSVEDAE
jgi:hypothetical protein